MTMTIPPRIFGIEAAPSSALSPIPFPRLVRVECAKATDTRAARWLLALVALSTAAMMLAPILAPTSFDQTYTSYLGVAALAQVILLPVVAILMFTGEWSQRSAFTTFTQEPRRIRVVNAKLAASLILGGGAAVFGGVVTAAALGLASASGRALESNLTVGAITGYLIFVLLNVLAGVALGALLQSSATAIAASFALPAAFALLGTASTLVADWIDMSTLELGAREPMGRSRAADLGLGPLLGGRPASRRRRPDDPSRRHVVGLTGAWSIEMRRSPPEPGSSFNGTSREPAPSRSSTKGILHVRRQDPHPTRQDLLRAFDPTEFEAALNTTARAR